MTGPTTAPRGASGESPPAGEAPVREGEVPHTREVTSSRRRRPEPGAVPSDAVQSGAEPSDVAPSDVAPSGAEPAGAVPSGGAGTSSDISVRLRSARAP